MSDPQHDAKVREHARALGFEAVGIARADVPLDADFDRYEAFVDQGLHGEMDWLANYRDVRQRLDTDNILEGAKSVVCLARRYQRPAGDEALDPPTAQAIARYARGRDYHGFLTKALKRLAVFIASLGTTEAPVRTRVLCDSAPILERAWAARSGLGFVGKNGLLIVPGQGSFVLLGEVVTTLPLSSDAPIRERCGSCTRCLDVCPTDAFVAPFVLDPRKCLAYLTIEHRSAIPEGLRDAMGGHLFGCDDCQTVCPFNASFRPRDPESVTPFLPHPRWGETGLEAMLSMAQSDWDRLSEGTPVRRATADGLARNAAIVLGNTGTQASIPALEQAEHHHPSGIVREAAAWAKRKIAAPR